MPLKQVDPVDQVLFVAEVPYTDLNVVQLRLKVLQQLTATYDLIAGRGEENIDESNGLEQAFARTIALVQLVSVLAVKEGGQGFIDL